MFAFSVYILKTGHLKLVYTQFKSIYSVPMGLCVLTEILDVCSLRSVNKLYASGILYTNILLNPIMTIYDAIF